VEVSSLEIINEKVQVLRVRKVVEYIAVLTLVVQAYLGVWLQACQEVLWVWRQVLSAVLSLVNVLKIVLAIRVVVRNLTILPANPGGNCF